MKLWHLRGIVIYWNELKIYMIKQRKCERKSSHNKYLKRIPTAYNGRYRGQSIPPEITLTRRLVQIDLEKMKSHLVNSWLIIYFHCRITIMVSDYTEKLGNFLLSIEWIWNLKFFDFDIMEDWITLMIEKLIWPDHYRLHQIAKIFLYNCLPLPVM